MDWNSSSDEDDDLLNEAVLQAVHAAVENTAETKKTPMRTGQTGQEYIDELFNSGNDRRIYDVLRMSLSSFNELHD